MRYLRRKVGKKLQGKWLVVGDSRDMKSAYKQIPMDESQVRYVVIAIFDMEAGRWRFVVTRTLLFGLSGAVLLFNRVPAFIVALARRWLAIAVHAFFDDFRIVDFASENGSAGRWFDKLVQFLGWKFDDEKTQSRMLALPMLGNIENYGIMGCTEELQVSAKPERIAEIRAVVVEAH